MEQDFKKHTSYIGIFTNALNQQKHHANQKNVNEKQLQMNQVLMSKLDEVNAENAQLKLMFQRFSEQI